MHLSSLTRRRPARHAARHATLAVVPLVALLAARPAPAQRPNPVDDLLRRGGDALDNLQYEGALTYAREVLSIGPRLKRSQEVRALQLAAAALYPEDTARQRPDSAATVLARLVRIAPQATFPEALAWRGLDSLAAQTRRARFGAAADPNTGYSLVGTDVLGPIPVLATKPARFRLLVARLDGAAPIAVDSLDAVTEGVLRLRAHDGQQALLRAGEYELLVEAVRADVPDTIRTRYRATATGFPPTLMQLPVEPDPARLLPERAVPSRIGGITTGVLLGAAAMMLARYARPTTLRDRVTADGRAVAVGVVIGLGASVGGYLDRGRPLRANIAANRALREEYAQNVALAREVNRTRIADYRVAVTVDVEGR